MSNDCGDVFALLADNVVIAVSIFEALARNSSPLGLERVGLYDEVADAGRRV